MSGRTIDPGGREGASRDGPEGRNDARANDDLSDRYLACLRILEALPENLSGADKTWVEQALGSFREHYQQARRVR